MSNKEIEGNMKAKKGILIAFVLNLAFSVFELLGGMFTNSVAILSDSLHDIGDALSIGLSYVFEKKAGRKPDDNYTYGYERFSVLGGFITVLILISGSFIVIFKAVERIFNPVLIDYNSMIVFAVLGVVVNFCGAYFTHGGKSINERAVSLHLIEDVLGWIVVLIGAVFMKFTSFWLIDPLMSIAVAVFILVTAFKSFKEIIDLFTFKTPSGISVSDIRNTLLKNLQIKDVHHIHIWSMNGQDVYATMHIVSDVDNENLRSDIRKILEEKGISHLTIQFEDFAYCCEEKECKIIELKHSCNHHHHH